MSWKLCWPLSKVYNCLQPFTVCMSSKSTSALIDVITEDFDREVLEWVNEVDKCIEVKMSIIYSTGECIILQKIQVTNNCFLFEEYTNFFEDYDQFMFWIAIHFQIAMHLIMILIQTVLCYQNGSQWKLTKMTILRMVLRPHLAM